MAPKVVGSAKHLGQKAESREPEYRRLYEHIMTIEDLTMYLYDKMNELRIRVKALETKLTDGGGNGSTPTTDSSGNGSGRTEETPGPDKTAGAGFEGLNRA